MASKDRLVKQVVQRHFDRAASRYSGLAFAQKHIVDRLLAWLPDRAAQVLDLGCGPGLCCQPLAARYPEANLWGIDISGQMLKQARTLDLEVSWVQADAAEIPLPDHSLDLVFSNLMLQWCCSPLSVFREIRRVLHPGGCVLLSTLLPGSLRELESAQLRSGLQSRILEFSSSDLYQLWAAEAGLRQVQLVEEEVQFFYPDPRHLLHSVSKIGAGATSATDFLGKSAYGRLLRHLEEQRTPRGLPLSYQVLCLELRAEELC